MRYGYVRVSTAAQGIKGNSIEEQKQKLKENGAEEIYVDVYTGTTTDRPEFSKLTEKLKEGDTLIITKLDRLARSLKQGVIIVDNLLERNIKVNVINLGGILDNSSMSSFMRHVLLAFAQLERDMIVERTQAGKRIAKENNPNFKEGRPKKYSKEKLDHAMKELENKSYREVENLLGISKSTLIREKRRRGLI